MPRFKVLCDDQGHRFYRTVISFDRKTAMRDAVVLTYSTAIDATEVDENGIEISTEPASEVQQGGKQELSEPDDSEDYWAEFSHLKGGERVISEANFKCAIRKCESMRSKILTKIIEETPKSIHDKVNLYGFAVNILKEYTDFLLKEGYCDTDVYAEEPTAIDQFMQTKHSDFFEPTK